MKLSISGDTFCGLFSVDNCHFNAAIEMDDSDTVIIALGKKMLMVSAYDGDFKIEELPKDG